MSDAIRAVVVTWNGRHLLEPCLASLKAQRLDRTMEIVVVDNASADGTSEWLAAAHPDIRVVVSPKNLGFAGGASLGMSGFQGDFFVLLNNDATFEPDAVAALVGCASAPGNETVGAVTAKVLLDRATPGPILVNSTGNLVTSAGTGADRDWLVPSGEETTDADVFGFCGGAALLRRTAVDDVGPFDPYLFLYYEDTDLSWRMRARGWTVRYEPMAVAHHRHASSSGVDTPLFRYYNTRNSLVVFLRHAPLVVVAGSFLRQFGGLVREARRSGARGPLTVARARALRDAVLRLPRTWGERRRTWTGSPVPRADVARYVEPPAPGRSHL